MNVELMKALEQIEEEKGIGKEVIIEAIEAALLSAYKKNYGASAQNMRIEVDRDTGEMRAYQIRTIVETVEDEHTQISLAEAQQWDPSAKIGDMVEVEVTPRDFGRIAAQTAKQVVVQRLREAERDLVYEGIVEIKAIAREAGARSKFAVASRDKNVDAVGACVGPKGTRVQSIVDELKGEKIDIVPWNADPALFVAGALSPAKVTRVELDEETKTALVIVPDHQLSLAIGREGQNARLAAKLTGWRIDIKSETQIKEIETKKLFVDLPEEEAAVPVEAQPVVAGQAGAEASGETAPVPAEPPNGTEAQGEVPAQALALPEPSERPPEIPAASGAAVNAVEAADGEGNGPFATSADAPDPDEHTKKTAEADA